MLTWHKKFGSYINNPTKICKTYFPAILSEKGHVYLEILEEWYLKILGKIISIDRVETKTVLYKFKKKRNNLYKAKKKGTFCIKWKKKVNSFCHILRRNCFLKHVTEEKIERKTGVTARRIRRRKQLLNDLKEKRPCL
jgi:hypothetical protein